MRIPRVAPLTVDPAALSAAGAAVVAIGDDVAAALGALTAGFSANTGQDAAGEVFGLAYQDAAGALMKAAAAAINALRFNGAKIELCASNYSKAEAASTLGGGGGVLPAPGEPVKIAAPGPPGTLGPGVAAPLLWAVVEALIDGVWPNGDVAALRAAAGRWRAFGQALTAGQDALNQPRSAVDGQQIPEGALIQPVLSRIGSHMGELGAQCAKLASKLDAFAGAVAHTQNAIRDLLHRLGTVSGLWHEVEAFFDGDELEEIKKVASDINALLHGVTREAEAKAQIMKGGMQIIDGWVRDMEKYMRGEFTHFLGQAVGNQVATVFDTYVNIDEGVFKGAVGLVQTVEQLDPTRFLYDPKGAASTWAGLGETVVKANPLYALVDPNDALKNDLGLAKGLVHAEDWRSDRPGLGFGENLFDVATFFVPGAGEAGAGAEGAAAGTRAATDAADAAGTVGRAGRVAGEAGETAGAGAALADIGKAGGGLTKDFENLGGELPKPDPPVSGRPVGLSDSKPLDAPVEPTARMDSAMSGKGPFDPPAALPAAAGGKGPFDPPTAPPGFEPPEPPGTPLGPREPVPGPGGGPGEPASAPAGGPTGPDAGPAGGRPSALPTPNGGGVGPHGLGHGAPVGSPLPGRTPHDVSNGNSPGGRPPGEQPLRDNTPHGPHDGGGDHDRPSNGGDHSTDVQPFSWDDRLALADYTGSGYEDLNSALRSDVLDASQHARVAAINNALEKLPPYQGPVIRGTNLPPEVLDQYRPGEIIKEDAFLSTSTNTAVARSPSFAGNVEFRILSSSGRDISSVSMFPDEQEVLFPSGTTFYVVSKVLDSLTGRTVIRMIER
ncbi:MAG TPA: ADP-ribosyltransferase [Rhodopila sp.]